MAQTFPDLRAAAIDGRMQNVFYRQHQLEALHHSIIDHASEIRQALKSDYGYSSAESTVELHLTVETLKRVYGNLEPDKMLADEYAVATGNDAPSNRVPAGIVYIQPSSHSLLFSIVAPLSTAIAAGNCVIILLERNLRVLTSVIRRALSGALHPDIFAFASSIVHDPTILKSAIIVDQDSSERWPNASRLASPSDSCTLAVVDRTADVRLAARELAAASLAFGGSSPYAPDVVLVNEFAKKDFLQALVEETRRVMDQNGLNESQKNELTKGQRVTNEIRSLKEIDPNIRIIIQEPNLVIVEMVRGHVDIVRFKRSIPLLTVYAVKSLDDAIDFVSSANAGPALAAYHFGNGHVGKYLAQFIDARISLVNHILRELLVGPANPAGYAVDPRSRYNVEMFTLPRPTFIRKPATASRLAEVMASTDGTTVRRLLDEALSPMKSMKRKPGGGVGFFEQGFLINAGMILTITVSATIVGSMWLFQRERLSLLGLRLAMKVES